MADRYAFQSPFARGDQDGWFRVGTTEVTTTVAIAGVALIMFFVNAIEGAGGPIFRALRLTDSDISNGQLWRLFTWPIPNDVSIWGFITILFFFLIGQQLESFLGRRTYAILIGALIVIPTIVALLVSFGLGQSLGIAGVRWLLIGVIAAFVVAFPNAQSFFGIPFWILAAVIFVLDFLQLLSFRSFAVLAMLVVTAIVGLVFSRSLGYGEEWGFIPSIPLPASVTGSSASTVPRASRPRRKKAARSRGNLRSVPMPAASEAEIDALLDQVAEHGIGSLTKEQKATLKRHSEAMRRKRDED